MVTRQTDQSQVTLLKSLSTAQSGCRLGRTWSSRAPDGDRSHGAHVPARFPRVPGPEVGSWSWRKLVGARGTPPGQAGGADSLPLFKTGKAERGPPLGPRGGDAFLVLQTPGRVLHQSTGRGGVRRPLPEARPAQATPQGTEGVSGF